MYSLVFNDKGGLRLELLNYVLIGFVGIKN